MDSPTHIEDTIVSLLHQQDKESIRLIYQHYGSSLLGIIYRIIGDQEIAEDVYQESIIKIWRNGKNYDPEKGRLFTWLLNICRNSAIDYIRSVKFKRKQTIQREEDLVSKKDYFYDINVEIIGLTDLVQKLEPKYQEVINIVYLEEYSHAEAAKKLGLPLGTLKTRIRTAINLLKQYI